MLRGAHSGSTSALSLLVVLRGEGETFLYACAGGIQTSVYVTASGQQSRSVPEALGDEGRNREAVRIALEPLLGGAPSKGSPAAR